MINNAMSTRIDLLISYPLAPPIVWLLLKDKGKIRKPIKHKIITHIWIGCLKIYKPAPLYNKAYWDIQIKY